MEDDDNIFRLGEEEGEPIPRGRPPADDRGEPYRMSASGGSAVARKLDNAACSFVQSWWETSAGQFFDLDHAGFRATEDCLGHRLTHVETSSDYHHLFFDPTVDETSPIRLALEYGDVSMNIERSDATPAHAGAPSLSLWSKFCGLRLIFALRRIDFTTVLGFSNENAVLVYPDGRLAIMEGVAAPSAPNPEIIYLAWMTPDQLK